ncbi:aminopeptidase [candidate division KSB1 bacterium]|nr:MAG: aminopeptidase [candidate division KSB1 bacterium]
MADPRYVDLARVLVRYSTAVKAGDNVLIEGFDVPPEFMAVLVQEVCDVGGNPVLEMKSQRVQRKLYLNATEDRMKLIADCELYRMKKMNAYIGVRGIFNAKELSDVPGDQMGLYERLWMKPVHLEQRVGHTRWVVLRFPSPQMAQMAKMSLEAFEDFFYKVCTKVDWAKASEAMNPVVEFMKKTDKVRIVSPGTDLRFSIKGINVMKCDGHFNIPDLEIFTAPVRDSVEGVIQYNAPSTNRGFTFENVRFRFEKGKIVEASANDTARLNTILDTDEGARYIGEFALGFHPYIEEAMDDILFDEKISGSFHFTPGNAYENEADNGNRSAIHWDLVLIQRPEKGGGEIYFDDQLIRKDGKFVHEAFVGLNPENLRKN